MSYIPMNYMLQKLVKNANNFVPKNSHSDLMFSILNN